MSDRKAYQQKMRAQLDEWKAELEKLKAKASGASADARLEMNEQLRSLESKIDEGKEKLSQLGEATEEAWDDIKDSVESAWTSLKTAFGDAAAKFKK